MARARRSQSRISPAGQAQEDRLEDVLRVLRVARDPVGGPEDARLVFDEDPLQARALVRGRFSHRRTLHRTSSGVPGTWMTSPRRNDYRGSDFRCLLAIHTAESQALWMPMNRRRRVVSATRSSAGAGRRRITIPASPSAA